MEGITPAARAAREHARRVQGLRQALERAHLEPDAARACPYLPGRTARFTYLDLPPASGAYHALMDLGFRRVGRYYYRPTCESCHECRTLRLPLAALRLNRSQRRCWRANGDVQARLGPPQVTPEKLELYRRYLAARHDAQMEGSWDELSSLLYAPLPGRVEVVYRVSGRLLAAALVDTEPRAWSAVYCYFDPAAARRAPGTFNILWTAAEARRRGADYLYLGYFVAASPRMAYKARFAGAELLARDGGWRPIVLDAQGLQA